MLWDDTAIVVACMCDQSYHQPCINTHTSLVQVVRLAFETIEKIVREYFGHITETETTTFTDCVNCLIAFTNNPHSLDVSLNAIAFLRYCAIQLAEGEIGVLSTCYTTC